MGVQMERIARNGGLFPIDVNGQRSMRRRSATPRSSPPTPKQTTKRIRANSTAKSAAKVKQNKVSAKSKKTKSTAADSIDCPPAAISSSNPEEPTQSTVTIPVKRRRVEAEITQSSQDPLPITEHRPMKRVKRAAHQPSQPSRVSRRLQHLAPEDSSSETLELTTPPTAEYNRSDDVSPGRTDGCRECPLYLTETRIVVSPNAPGEYRQGAYTASEDTSMYLSCSPKPWHFEGWPLPPAPPVFRSLALRAA
ncbi:hypothetical protein CYLTODRAFT_226452 [Cylindrobasidium torrendii FP15055 ss-10]|uniref:Uncharacterized protein n=1 Tax=Cylindrobasidium torrendii FP15055 ss-10 TaxID=1314674 RepID=A0A0D7BG37_9AGAR|nr:hypothetical protein CYLTODRAFT_226452 [Cylindrobasidium torrendii FP15055 ss-10]